VEQKKAQRRKVSVGSIQGEAVEVIDGLTDEDWIIVAGQHKLRDGQDIQIDDKQLVSLNP